jgi:hypothetical protein
MIDVSAIFQDLENLETPSNGAVLAMVDQFLSSLLHSVAGKHSSSSFAEATPSR